MHIRGGSGRVWQVYAYVILHLPHLAVHMYSIVDMHERSEHIIAAI